MTADEIKALVKRLRKHSETGTCFEGTMRLANNAANALDGLTQDIEDLKHDNASMLDSLTKESVARCEAEDRLEIATQELKNIANADTIAWDDPTEYEAWAKSRARWALGKVEEEPK